MTKTWAVQQNYMAEFALWMYQIFLSLISSFISERWWTAATCVCEYQEVLLRDQSNCNAYSIVFILLVVIQNKLCPFTRYHVMGKSVFLTPLEVCLSSLLTSYQISKTVLENFPTWVQTLLDLWFSVCG